VPVPGLISCARCEVGFDPRLVGRSCPVCSTPAPGFVNRRATAPDLALYLVGAATIANVLLLAILAAYLLS
jgi:hypothetical protein